ncbi:uncharacterized protein LOC135475245 [Liolophura sinensis]|uniref:uncharacterized protein LOC135475245 n=1 Tax=Liolophura sinensis TaxID=3198878 RepID=UPI0031594EC9
MANHLDSFLSDPSPVPLSTQSDLVAITNTPDPASNSVPEQPTCIAVKIASSDNPDPSSCTRSLPEVKPEADTNPGPVSDVQKTCSADDSGEVNASCSPIPNGSPQEPAGNNPHTSTDIHHKAAEDPHPFPLGSSLGAGGEKSPKNFQEASSQNHPDPEKNVQGSACEKHSEKSLNPGRETNAADILTKDSSEQAVSNSTETSSRRSERKAKAFARVRLVLAHEQLIDDDNFLGFTNRKTYLPPKKRKKLCQFKAEHHQVKPKLPNSTAVSGSKKGSNRQKVECTSTGKASQVKDKIKKKQTDESLKKTSSVSTGEENSCGTDNAAKKNNIKPKRTIPKLEWFNCDYCHYKTSNKYYIRRHEMTHEKPKISFECHYCDYVTKSVIRYKEHEAQHTHEKPFKCQHCDYCSRSYTDFRRHQAKHASEKKYKCPHCDFTTKWSRNVSHHVLKHTTARPHKCHICGFSFKRIQDLKYHLYRHNDVKPISCDRCDFKCKTNYELRCHKLKHSDERFFACTHPGCGQKTKTKSDLTKHMNIHNVEKKYICGVCQKGFNAKSTLAKHVRIHGDRVLLKCDICQKNLKTRASLQGHLKLHQGLYPFACDICHRRFAVKWNLLKHQETHTLGGRPYRCPICPYGARTMEHLLTHIGSMHGKSYAYFCEICRKPFKRYGQLKIHMGRMHETTLSQTAPLNMESMLKEVEPDIKKGIKEEELASIGEGGLELVEVKQEPVETLSLDPTNVAALITDNSSQCTASETRSEPSMSRGTVDQSDIVGTELKPEMNPSLIEEGKPVATVGIYNGFTLPLATKGFEFNLEKRGKKPDSWFMDLQNMPSKAADKHKQYLYKKEHGLLVNHKPRLPKDKAEREAERRRRKLEKFIISCRVSTKSDTTLIFQTEKQKKKCLKLKKKVLYKSMKCNTVAALLQRSEKNKGCSSELFITDQPRKIKSQSKCKRKKKSGVQAEKIQSSSTRAYADVKGKEEADNEANVGLPLKETFPNTDISESPQTSVPCSTDPNRSNNMTSPAVICETNISTGNVPVKRKRGRPKGSRNKCLQPSSQDKALTHTNTEGPVCITKQPRKCAVKTKVKRTLRSGTETWNSAEKIKSDNEKGVGDIQPMSLDEIPEETATSFEYQKDELADNRKPFMIKNECVMAPTLNTKKPTSAEESKNVLSDACIVVKRKRGRPKGSLNKKTLARMASTKASTTLIGKGEQSEKELELAYTEANQDYPGPSPVCYPNFPSSETPDVVAEDNATVQTQPELEVKSLEKRKEKFHKESEAQANIRQCSVALSVIRDNSLKTGCLHLPPENPVETVVLKKDGNLEAKLEDPAIRDTGGLVEMSSIPDASSSSDDQKGSHVSAVGDSNVPLSAPAICGGNETSNVGRKRRKPNKSEIRRKCRKPGSCQVGLFSCVYEDGNGSLTSTGPTHATSEVCIKAEVLSDDADGISVRKPSERTFQTNASTTVSMNASPKTNAAFLEPHRVSDDHSKTRSNPNILTAGSENLVKQEPMCVGVSVGETFHDNRGDDNCPDNLTLDNSFFK